MKALISLTLLVILSNQATAADLIKITPQQQKNLNIKTVKLQAATSILGQFYPAEIVVPVNQISIVSSAYAGLIDQLQVTMGQTVKKGQVIGHVISPELVSMQREYLQSNAQKRLTKQSLDRDEALFKDGIIAEKRLQATQSNHLDMVAEQNERRQLLKLCGLSESAINKLAASGTYQNGMTLVAPIAGVVLEQMASQGQRVDATTPILKIAQLNPLWLEIHVPLADIKNNNIQIGAKIAVKDVDATGKVITLLPNMRAQEQTAIVRAEIKQGSDTLFPSQMVDAMVIPSLNSSKNSFNVATSSLINFQGKTIIFVQNQQGFEALEVKVIFTQGTTSRISGKLNGNELVVTSGTAAIKASWLGIGGMEDE